MYFLVTFELFYSCIFLFAVQPKSPYREKVSLSLCHLNDCKLLSEINWELRREIVKIKRLVWQNTISNKELLAQGHWESMENILMRRQWRCICTCLEEDPITSRQWLLDTKRNRGGPQNTQWRTVGGVTLLDTWRNRGQPQNTRRRTVVGLTLLDTRRNRGGPQNTWWRTVVGVTLLDTKRNRGGPQNTWWRTVGGVALLDTWRNRGWPQNTWWRTVVGVTLLSTWRNRGGPQNTWWRTAGV